jgi:uncharacterized protein YjbI with pentapeptide repeats
MVALSWSGCVICFKYDQLLAILQWMLWCSFKENKMGKSLLVWIGVVLINPHIYADEPINQEGQQLYQQDFSGRNFEKANLRKADFRGSRFRQARLRCADFSMAALQGVSFYGADLSGATLISANLVGADLRYANLTCAKMAYTLVEDANFGQADLRGTILEGAIGKTLNMPNASRNAAIDCDHYCDEP